MHAYLGRVGVPGKSMLWCADKIYLAFNVKKIPNQQEVEDSLGIKTYKINLLF